MTRTWFRSWVTHVALAALAVGVVIAAPLASTKSAATDTVIIAGARSISDQVGVTFAKPGSTRRPMCICSRSTTSTVPRGGRRTTSTASSREAPPTSRRPSRTKQAQYGGLQATILAGDNIGASPLANGLFHEEPITIVSNLMHVDFASVGNHEFDKGSAELLRIQNGGCHADRVHGRALRAGGGGTTNTYPGADFQYLSANVVVERHRRDAVPRVRRQGVHIRQRQEVRRRLHR